MATRTPTTTGLFSSMLDERLRNWGKRLDPEAIALLDRMQFARELAGHGDERDSPAAQGSLDQLTFHLIERFADQDEISLVDMRGIIDFFCPGLPPIC